MGIFTKKDNMTETAEEARIDERKFQIFMATVALVDAGVDDTTVGQMLAKHWGVYLGVEDIPLLIGNAHQYLVEVNM